MKPQYTILEELREIAPNLVEIGNTMPYQVREGYFDDFSGSISEKTQFELPQKMETLPFQVPDHYFSGLADQVLQKAKAMEFPEKIKVIPMRKMRHWVTYAAAAMLTAVMVTGSFMFSDKKQASDFEKYRSLDIPSTLDQVTEADLNAYLDSNPVVNTEDVLDAEAGSIPNTKEKIENLSNENLHHFLSENRDLEPNGGTGSEK